MKKLRIAILAGFIAEVFCFFLSGYSVAQGKTSESIIIFFIALFMAWLTGENIKKIAVKEYEHEKSLPN